MIESNFRKKKKKKKIERGEIKLFISPMSSFENGIDQVNN